MGMITVDEDRHHIAVLIAAFSMFYICYYCLVKLCADQSASDYLMIKMDELLAEPDVNEKQCKVDKLVDLCTDYVDTKKTNKGLSCFFIDKMDELVEDKDIKKNHKKMKKLVDLYSDYKANCS